MDPLFREEKHKSVYSLILSAEKFYLSSEKTKEFSVEKLCQEALQLLDTCSDGFPKWILTCNSKSFLFLSILRELRSMHIAKNPLDSSKSIAPNENYLVPRPVEKLCPAAFRNGFDRLREILREIYIVWHERLVPAYPTLKTALEKKAVINITSKLMVISLLGICDPLDALEPCLYICEWTKHRISYRWLVTLLIGLGFPKTASAYVKKLLPYITQLENDNAEKHPVTPLLQQAIRFGHLVDETAQKDEHSNQESNGNISIRLSSIIRYIDCYEFQRPTSAEANGHSLGATMIKARKEANFFYAYNKMDTCATVDPGDIPNLVDTYWYLQMLLNDALLSQRIGRVKSAEVKFKEGLSISLVLCAPHWILQFATHLAELQLLLQSSDPQEIEKLIFVQKIFSDEVKSSKAINPAKVAVDSAGSSKYGKPISGKQDQIDENGVELSRRSEIGPEKSAAVSKIPRSVHTTRAKNMDSKTKHQSNSANESPIKKESHLDKKNLNVTIFQLLMSNLTAPDPVNSTVECLKCLRSMTFTKFNHTCSCHNVSCVFQLDNDEFSAYINEPLWKLLDFCLLAAAKTNGVENFGLEDVKVVNQALDTLPSTNLSLFSLYYRLTFSYLLAILENRYEMDIMCQKMNDLKLKNATETKTRSGKIRAVAQHINADNSKSPIGTILDQLKKYGHLQFYPWYRLVKQWIGAFYLTKAPAMGISIKHDWQTSAAVNFVESMGLTFRWIFNEKMKTKDISRPQQLQQLSDHYSLMDALAELPHDWTVVSLHMLQMVSHRHVIMCRMSSRCRPIVMDLGDVSTKFNAIEEFAKLSQEIEASIKGKREDKTKYWEIRNGLERKLDTLLETLELEWFGHRRALFSGFSHAIQSDIFKRGGSAFNDRDLEILLTAVACLNDSETEKYTSDVLQLNSIQKKKFFSLAKKALLLPGADVGPVFLILDTGLHGIPWEVMPSMRGRPVCRIPCLQYLVRSISSWKLPKMVSSERTFYVVNPAGDLNMVEDYFKWFTSLRGWRGIFKEQPDMKTMENALANNDIHIYCGHGAGVQCLNSLSKVEQLVCKAAVLLMGCSSAKVVNNGPIFESESHPHSYLVAQSPCVIGCLWGVTSPDIDKFLACVLKLWLKAQPPESWRSSTKKEEITSLLSAIAQANSACKLKLLTGGAVVAYGLPIECHEAIGLK